MCGSLNYYIRVETISENCITWPFVAFDTVKFWFEADFSYVTAKWLKNCLSDKVPCIYKLSLQKVAS